MAHIGGIQLVSTDHVELMQVQERFALKRDGLTLVPDFPAPHHDKWNDFYTQVLVITPNGEQKEFQAKFTICHFNFRDPGVDISRRWRIVVSLPYASKEDVPIGARVWVTRDTKRALGVADS
jgi:hypothetical protein